MTYEIDWNTCCANCKKEHVCRIDISIQSTLRDLGVAFPKAFRRTITHKRIISFLIADFCYLYEVDKNISINKEFMNAQKVER